MQRDEDLQKQFCNSLESLGTSWERLDKYDRSIGRRKPTGSEKFVVGVMLADMIAKILIVARDGDNLIRGY